MILHLTRAHLQSVSDRMRRKTVRTLLMLISIVAASCTKDAASSADVPEWKVDSVPLVEIATDDTLETIGNVTGVARLRDGRVAVADQSNSVIKIYDSTGTFLRNVGRAGSGPGEFEMLGDMRQCGDSLYAHDYAKDDFALVTADGVFGRRVKIVPPDSTFVSPSSVCNAKGQFIVAGWQAQMRDSEKAGPLRGPAPLWISDATGKLIAALGTHQSSELWQSEIGDGIIVVGPRPLGKETMIALGSTKAYVGTADSSSVAVYDFKGVALPPLATASTTRRTTAADISAFELRDTIALSAANRVVWVNQRKNMKYPEVLPAYSALLVDGDDNVWIRAFPNSDVDDVAWQVFSESGAPVATVRLPVTLRVTEVRSDHLAGILSDPVTGRQRVVVMRLRRQN